MRDIKNKEEVEVYRLITLLLRKSVSPKSLGFLLAHLKVKNLKQKRVLFTEGSIDNNIYFLRRGLVKAYFEKNGELVISDFLKNGDFITNLPSAFSDGTAWRTIQAVTDVELIYFTKEDFMQMLAKYPELSHMYLDAMVKYYVNSDKRIKILFRIPAKDRYLFFENNYKEFVNKIPRYEIASFLDISPETLSRVKKKEL
jgi:CRP/FNR family transcriptional regulator, anaerobic regulatory protein